jgi:hypothetical protein
MGAVVTTQSQAVTDQRPAAAPARGQQSRASPGRLGDAGPLPWVVVLLAPVAGVVLLRAPLVNMLSYIDPWLYSGYGWAPAHHIEMFGWPYYADRFTVILPIAMATGLLGPVSAYLVVHYALMAGCGVLLYMAVRRFASVPVAAAAVCLLMLNPFFVRLMLWDYTTFVALPCTIAGAALWYLGSTRTGSLWTALGAGICLSAAVYANPLSGLVLPPLLGVETIAAIRNGRTDVITLVLRGCAMVAGALLVVAVGYLGYRAYIGPFPFKLMFQATIAFLRSNSQFSAVYQLAPSVWLRTDPQIYAPLLVCLGTVVVFGRGLLTNTLRSRIAQFAIAYTLVFWVYRFMVTSSVIETYYAYDMTAVTAAFAMPAVLDELGRRGSRARWLVVAGVAVGATGLIDLIIRTMDHSALSVFEYVRMHSVVLACGVVAGSIAAVLMTLLKRDRTRLIAVASFCAIAAAIGLAPTPGQDTGEFSPFGTMAELDAYQAGYAMTRLVARYDRPTSRVLLWDDMQGLGNVGWANLPDEGGGIDNVFQPPPIPKLTPYELEVLRHHTTTRVLALSESVDEVASAVPALQRQGLGPSLETEGVWASGHLYYALIKLHTS